MYDLIKKCWFWRTIVNFLDKQVEQTEAGKAKQEFDEGRKKMRSERAMKGAIGRWSKPNQSKSNAGFSKQMNDGKDG